MTASNIAEGRFGDANVPGSAILALGAEFKALGSDVILINELVRYVPAPNQHLEALAEMTGLAYFGAADTVAMGIEAHKAVAVLSRYPITDERYDAPPDRSGGTSAFGIYSCTIVVPNGIEVRLASLRFVPHNDDRDEADYQFESEGGHEILARLADPAQSGEWPVFIAGGDFNAPFQSEQFSRLLRNSQLNVVYWGDLASTEKDKGTTSSIDHLMFRGLIDVETASNSSVQADHPALTAVFWIPGNHRDARPAFVTPFEPVVANRPMTARIRMLNCGAATWTPQDGFALARYVEDTAAPTNPMPVSGEVAASDSATWDVTETAPAAGQTIQLQWRMCVGAEWFGLATGVTEATAVPEADDECPRIDATIDAVDGNIAEVNKDHELTTEQRRQRVSVLLEQRSVLQNRRKDLGCP